MSVNFSADSDFLVTGSGDSTAKIWDIATGQELQTLSTGSARVFSAVFNNSGTWLATGSADRSVKLWKMNDFYRLDVGSQVARACERASQTGVKEFTQQDVERFTILGQHPSKPCR
jgi:WD40 repeat protein